MRIAFLGSGEFGLPTLRALTQRHDVVGVVSQPDRPAGRGGKLTPTPISDWVRRESPSIPLIRPEDVNQPDIVAAVHAWRPDAMVIIAFGQKLSPALLGNVFAINLHASLLPRWRGAAPINWAILAGDAVTGNSVISIAERMDAGLVYAQSRRDVTPAMTAGQLHDALSSDGPELILRVLADHAKGTAVGAVQDESLKTRALKLSREMAVVDFAKPADACRCTINGLSPWPGVTVRFRDEPLKLLRAQPAPQGVSSNSQKVPGALADADTGLVHCAPGTMVQLLEVQPAGKRPMPWADFARGRRVAAGELLVGGPAPC